MAIVYDTNALITIVRDTSFSKEKRKKLNPENEPEYISYISIAEIESFAYRNNWGNTKRKNLQFLYNLLNVVNIDDEILLKKYIEIDAFSQLKHQSIISTFKTPRNMGKHDIWIAATASVLDMALITTDSDFDHLDKVFLNLMKFSPSELI